MLPIGPVNLTHTHTHTHFFLHRKDEMSFALGIPTADGGLVVAGCPVGEAEFIADSASGASREVEKLV